jgi:hypothetical protein
MNEMKHSDIKQKEKVVIALYQSLGKERIQEFRKKCIADDPEYQTFFDEFDRKYPNIFG